MPRSSEWAISFRFPYQIRACISLLHLCTTLPLASPSPCCEHPHDAQSTHYAVVVSLLLLTPTLLNASFS
jgi:hypothetical protein